MTAPPYLTDKEILEIVEPLTQKAAICRWFRNSGFDVKPKPNGMPLVYRSWFEAPAVNDHGDTDDKGSMPDATALIASFRKKTNEKSIS